MGRDQRYGPPPRAGKRRNSSAAHHPRSPSEVALLKHVLRPPLTCRDARQRVHSPRRGYPGSSSAIAATRTGALRAAQRASSGAWGSCAAGPVSGHERADSPRHRQAPAPWSGAHLPALWSRLADVGRTHSPRPYSPKAAFKRLPSGYQGSSVTLPLTGRTDAGWKRESVRFG